MCIDEQLLSSYLDGQLSEPFKSQTEEHLSYCSACRRRLEKLKELSALIESASPSDEELARRKEQTFNLLEKKYFDSGKKISFFRRKIEFSIPAMITSAAAVVVVFIGGFILFGSNSRQTSEILPSYAVQADSANVRFVSSPQQGLDAYSLEEILKYLDSKGYNVDISIKGITPLSEDSVVDDSSNV